MAVRFSDPEETMLVMSHALDHLRQCRVLCYAGNLSMDVAPGASTRHNSKSFDERLNSGKWTVGDP